MAIKSRKRKKTISTQGDSVSPASKTLNNGKKIKIRRSAVPSMDIKATPKPPAYKPVISKPAPVETSLAKADQASFEHQVAAGAAESEIKNSGRSRNLYLYRKISLSFIILTLLLLAVIFYFSFVKVKITITPKEERVSGNLVVDVYGQKEGGVSRSEAIAGAVEQLKIEESKTYQSSGERIIGEEAIGMVMIYNNYTKNQPLVATTRLLSPDNKLYRIKNTVNVPAGGSVEAEIYADQPSAETAIDPTKFTIPGLWAGLQDKIYAENTAPIIFKQSKQKFIQQIDLDNAAKDLKEALIAKAETEVGAAYKKDYDQVVYQVDDNSISLKFDGKINDEKDDFSATIEAEVVVVAFNQAEVKSQAKEKLIASLPANKQLTEFNGEQINYNLSNFDLKEGTASINAVFDGQASFSDSNKIIKKDDLLGLTADQLKNYLSSLPEIEGYNIKFSPSFINKVPNLVDSIKIEIKK